MVIPDARFEDPSVYWAPSGPLLRPSMLMTRTTSARLPFPFNHENVQYVYLARNAINALVSHFGLAGADVLLPAYLHGIEYEALAAAGARPRFYPVRGGMRVDAEDIIASLRSETRAVYLIHYLGFPGPAAALREVCRERGLILIEDCALALFSRANGEPLGTFGDAAVFCIYKTLPAPDGGAVVLRNGKLALSDTQPSTLGTLRESAVAMLRGFESRGTRLQRDIARTMKDIGGAVAPRRDGSWIDVGTQRFDPKATQLTMSSVSHTIIHAQDVEQIVGTRRRNYAHLQDLLKDLSRPVFDQLPAGVCPLFYPLTTSRKHELWRRLRSSGIEAVLFWLPNEFAPPRGVFPEVDTLRDTVLELPCHQDLAAHDIERVAALVRRHARELN